MDLSQLVRQDDGKSFSNFEFIFEIIQKKNIFKRIARREY